MGGGGDRTAKEGGAFKKNIYNDKLQDRRIRALKCVDEL